MIYILNLPLKIFLGNSRKKKANGEKAERFFYVNLNQYRNADFHTLNKAKILFKELVQDQINKLPTFEWVTLQYYFFPGSHRDMDTNNVCSIADKFFSDALVESGKLEDDNYRFLRDTRFTPMDVDKTNPRVEVHIIGKEKEDPVQMQITLTNEDFMQALHNHVKAAFPVPEGVEPSFDITAGRGDKGYTAVVTFDLNQKKEEPAAPEHPIARAARKEGNVMQRLGTVELTPKPLDVTTAFDPPKEEAPAEGPEGQAEAPVEEPADEPITEPTTELPAATPAPAEDAPEALEPKTVTKQTSLFSLGGAKAEVAGASAPAGEAVGGASAEPAKPKGMFSFDAKK